MLIVDAHEDIAWNVLTFGRDYTHSAGWLQSKERDTVIPSQNGNSLLGREDWLSAQVAVIFSTLFASPVRKKLGDWDTQAYGSQEEAYEIYNRQIDIYEQLQANHPQFRRVLSSSELEAVLDTWSEGSHEDEHQIGLVTLMEGADPIRHPEEVEEWYERGVRIIGLSWEATRYAGGTHEAGPLTDDGRLLLKHMEKLGIILDLSHLAEEAYYQVLEAFSGVLIASHANPRRFLPTSRGLSDEMITLLAERHGVVGIVPYNSFLKPGWQKGSPKDQVSISDVVAAIDHVCQLTGSAQHVGVGTDFDGGFGVEHVPTGIETIADLIKLEDPLRQMGYEEDDIEAILGGNWLRILRSGLS